MSAHPDLDQASDSGVLILLATFNGDRFLSEQLRSIEQQTWTDWRVLASDDGSSDTTMEVLENFRSRNPRRFQFLKSPPTGSAKANFFDLLRASPPAGYVAFCDQDDVWLAEKLELLVAECQAIENENGRNQPCAVFCDLSVVDSALTIVAESFLREIAVDPQALSVENLLVENAIPGCAMLVNRALVDEFRAFDGPLSDARMHDWWLALIAASTGALGHVPTPLVLYRQHEHNSAGSVRRRGLSFALKKIVRGGRDETRANSRQAQLLIRAHGASLPQPVRDKVSAMAHLGERGKFARIVICLRRGILKQTATRRLYQLIRI